MPFSHENVKKLLNLRFLVALHRKMIYPSTFINLQILHKLMDLFLKTKCDYLKYSYYSNAAYIPATIGMHTQKKLIQITQKTPFRFRLMVGLLISCQNHANSRANVTLSINFSMALPNSGKSLYYNPRLMDILINQKVGSA